MRRRDFLKLSIVGAMAAAELSTLTGCESSDDAALQVFPQGVASGDPRPDRVVLWTRVEPDAAGSGAGDQQVEFELATDDKFTEVVARGTVVAEADADHTVRVLATGLSPATVYYYRFVARAVASTVGRTKTAPSPDADVPVRLGLASCQDFIGRYFHPWASMAEEPDLDLVVFLGDYIYETDRTAGARTPTEDRAVVLPDGLPLGTDADGKAAITLADYRALYRTYKTDPDLQKMHAAAPFVLIWDDHEFSNDCWQDRTYYFEGAEGDEQRTAAREAATRAWFEYLPVDLSWREGASFPDDIVTYRTLRYGQHAEFILIDDRYYRDAHLIQPGPPNPAVGKTGSDTQLGSRTFVEKAPFDQIEAAAQPTMLGATQRAWFLDAVRSSTASWKVWCNQTMAAQLLVDLRDRTEVADLIRKLFYFKLDQWDGYRSERAQLLSAVADVPGFAVLSGDLHGFYAAELRPDFDAQGPATTVEYVVSSISAPHLQDQLTAALQLAPILDALGLGSIIPQSDAVIMASNAHMRYSNSNNHGYAIVEIDHAAEMRVEFVTFADVKSPTRAAPTERVRFRTVGGTKTVERLT